MFVFCFFLVCCGYIWNHSMKNCSTRADLYRPFFDKNVNLCCFSVFDQLWMGRHLLLVYKKRLAFHFFFQSFAKLNRKLYISFFFLHLKSQQIHLKQIFKKNWAAFSIIQAGSQLSWWLLYIYIFICIHIYHVYIQVWHLITQKQENTTQIKAVGALVCHNKLRKSQTLAFAANSPDTVLQVSYKAMEWLHMLRSVVQHRQ